MIINHVIILIYYLIFIDFIIILIYLFDLYIFLLINKYLHYNGFGYLLLHCLLNLFTFIIGIYYGYHYHHYNYCYYCY